jgi:hypothetical protein
LFILEIVMTGKAKSFEEAYEELKKRDKKNGT